jgi:hypothetical protein
MEERKKGLDFLYRRPYFLRIVSLDDACDIQSDVTYVTYITQLCKLLLYSWFWGANLRALRKQKL